MRFTLAAGEAYRHYIECTWFGLPIMKINETYLDGQLRQELPVGVVASEPKADLAANLALWGEQAAWMPSVLATDPQLRWEAIGGDTARLTIPFGETEDNFTVRFDEQSGLVQSMEALRFREPKDEQKVPWRIDLLRWETFDRVRVPSTFAITWLDRGTPWLTATIEDVVYNVDVSQYIRASGP